MGLAERVLALGALLAVATSASLPAVAQQQQKPNIVVIMGDDIGMWNIIIAD